MTGARSINDKALVAIESFEHMSDSRSRSMSLGHLIKRCEPHGSDLLACDDDRALVEAAKRSLLDVYLRDYVPSPETATKRAEVQPSASKPKLSFMDALFNQQDRETTLAEGEPELYMKMVHQPMNWETDILAWYRNEGEKALPNWSHMARDVLSAAGTSMSNTSKII